MQIKKALKYFLIVIVFYLSLRGGLFAQYYEDDARIWMNVNLMKETKKGMEYQLLLQNRLNNNMTQYSGYCSAGLAYKFSKHFKLLGGYVVGGKQNLDGSYSLIQQAYAGFMLRHKINKFIFVYRNLIQTQAKGSQPLNDEKPPTTFDRNKFTVKYELNKRWQIYTSAEFYLTLNNSYKYDFIGKTRNIVGLIYKITKSAGIEPYFLFQKKYDFKNMASRNFIYGLTFNKSF